MTHRSHIGAGSREPEGNAMNLVYAAFLISVGYGLGKRSVLDGVGELAAIMIVIVIIRGASKLALCVASRFAARGGPIGE